MVSRGARGVEPAAAAKPPEPSGPVARLVELIDRDGRGDAEIARAAGIAPNHLYLIRTGRRRSIAIGTVAAILDALDRPFAALDTGDRAKPRIELPGPARATDGPDILGRKCGQPPRPGRN